MGILMKAGVKVTPYVIPHSAGMPESMVKALTKVHAKTIQLQGKIGVAKAIGVVVRMREQRGLTSDLALGVQQQVLGGAQRQTRAIGTEALRTTAREHILTGKVEGLYEDIAGLKQELRDRPVIVEQKLGFDWGLPSFEDIKMPLLIAGGAIAGLFILGKFVGRKS